MRLLIAIATILALAVPVSAQVEFDTKAKFAVLMDHETGSIIFQKDADARLEPASMTKLMTLAVVFNEIRAGRVSLEDTFFVSENAWRTGGAASGGSTMFAELNSQIRVEDLVRSVIIQSGNDAAIILAEGIAGTEATFALMMNELARDLGLDGSNFTNSTGLPDPDEYSTARDLAEVGRYLIREFPEYYHYFSEPEMEWNNIRQSNRNSLIDVGIGVDGLKTGHTNSAGYGVVLSTAQGDRRLIAVVHGLTSMRERAEEGRKLLTWGQRAFERFTPYATGAIVGYADVYGGEQPNVGMVGNGEIALFLPRGSRQCLSATLNYAAPLLPPVRQGDRVGELRVFCNDQLVQTAPLFAAEDVRQGDLVRRATDALKHLAIGWL